MLHSLAFILALIFAPALAIFALQHVISPGGLHHKFSFTSAWHITAIAMAVFGVLFSHVFASPITANFVMHAIGGGVVSFCLMMHIVKQLRLKLTWPQLALLLLAVVCILGVANELFEYALELAAPGKLVFSLDTHDTWRDLAANLCGGGLALLAYRLVKSVNHS